MQIILNQGKKGEIRIMIYHLMRMNGVKLTELCDQNGLEYGKVYRKLKSKSIELIWLKNLIEMIDPEATFTHEFSLSLKVDERVIFNHKS